jgi:hypothetical protein
MVCELQDGLVRARDANRTGFCVQTLAERRANRLHAAARKCARLEHHDPLAGVSKNAGGAQPRQPGADDNDG